MDWIEHFHKDHMEVLLLLTKLEGNLREVQHVGKLRSGVLLESREFVEVVEKVIRPHFLREEEYIYPAVVKLNPHASEFINTMLEEHQELYSAFDRFKAAVEEENPVDLITSGESVLRFLKNHIVKEEKQIPALLQQGR